MSLACSRSLFFALFIAGALVLGVSYYLQYAEGLKPSGLGLWQRLCLALRTGVCLIAALQGPGRHGAFHYWLLNLVCSLAGTVTAWRQVLLQSDPAHQLSTCVPDLPEVFANAPWTCILRLMFNGSIDCRQVAWTLFDLSLPEWSLLFFVAMMILAVYQLLRLVRISVRRPLGGDSSHHALARD
jgi:disulfide bond formation protein DsbB